MALPESYLITTKNLSKIINAVTNAQAPTRFSIKFLENLGFKSTNDRLYLKLFKELGLLDSSGSPTPKYYEFIDKTQTSKVLGSLIQETYQDVFALNKQANKMTKNEVKNKFKTLSQGSKSDKVLTLMANTFKSLCEISDFEASSLISTNNNNGDEGFQSESEDEIDNSRQTIGEIINKSITTEMHYNIQIHLPDTKDIAVYDAIFKSLKEHLL